MLSGTVWADPVADRPPSSEPPLAAFLWRGGKVYQLLTSFSDRQEPLRRSRSELSLLSLTPLKGPFASISGFAPLATANVLHRVEAENGWEAVCSPMGRSRLPSKDPSRLDPWLTISPRCSPMAPSPRRTCSAWLATFRTRPSLCRVPALTIPTAALQQALGPTTPQLKLPPTVSRLR